MKRDADYRGTKTTVDWSKLVHQVRTKKPGALEVLQDAIMIYFPKQFELAKNEAWMQAHDLNFGKAKARKGMVFVGLDARRARERFLPVGHRITSSMSPFVVVHTISTSAPRPHTAYVYGTTGKYYEHRAMRPKYTGSYKRPKLPIIYWYRRGSDEVDDDEIEETVLLVRGSGSAAWARNHDLYNGRWQIWRNDAGEEVGAILTLEGTDDWRADAREEGFRNKTQFLEYPPDRSFFG